MAAEIKPGKGAQEKRDAARQRYEERTGWDLREITI
jgi:hypothetical protein